MLDMLIAIVALTGLTIVILGAIGSLLKTRDAALGEVNQ